MAPATSTTMAPSATSADGYVLATTFTAPSHCAQSVGGLTMLKNDQYRIWLNALVPVPGTTITSCYPSQYVSSYLLLQGGVTEPAFSPLVCPAGYTTQGPFTSNYIACCPSGWDGLAVASNPPSDRPAFGATCYTNIYNKPLEITSYDDSSVKASSIFTATNSNAQAFALPYEGYAKGVAVVASLTSSNTAAPTSVAAATTSSSSSSFSSSSFSSSILPSSSAASASASATSAPSKGLHGGALAGAVVGSILGAALLAGAFLLLRFWRKKGDNARNIQIDGGSGDWDHGAAAAKSPQVSQTYSSHDASYASHDTASLPLEPMEYVKPDGYQAVNHHEMDSNQVLHEMGGAEVHELASPYPPTTPGWEKRLPTLPNQ